MVPGSQSSVEQMQVFVAAEKQQCWLAVGVGHADTTAPWTAVLAVNVVLHWQNCDVESFLQL
jgi:hypothetical protein